MDNAAMAVDRNGVPIKVGANVLWRPDGKRKDRDGTVRAVRKAWAMVDDGAPDNDDLVTNGHRCSEWVPASSLLVQNAGRSSAPQTPAAPRSMEPTASAVLSSIARVLDSEVGTAEWDAAQAEHQGALRAWTAAGRPGAEGAP